jgi:hypothetical protein
MELLLGMIKECGWMKDREDSGNAKYRFHCMTFVHTLQMCTVFIL